MWRRNLLLTLLLAGALPWAHAAPQVSISTQEPRAFGRFLGDKMTRKVTLDAPAGYSIPADALPTLSRVNAWVQLIGRSVQRTESSEGTRFELQLDYQLINSPLQPQLALLPGMTLILDGPEGRTEKQLTDFVFTLSPLSTADIREGLEELRPSRPPTLIPVRSTALFLALLATLSVLMLAIGFAGRLEVMWWQRSTPFSRAARLLRHLRIDPESPQRGREALKIVHRAFDETAGIRVFAEQLESFLRAHPQFSGLRQEILQFFTISRDEFFGHAAHTVSIESLAALCARMRSHERVCKEHHAPAV